MRIPVKTLPTILCASSHNHLFVYLFVCCVAANKSKVLWGIPRDPDLVAALQELEEEESETMGEDEKPKVGGGGGRKKESEGGWEGGREGREEVKKENCASLSWITCHIPNYSEMQTERERTLTSDHQTMKIT